MVTIPEGLTSEQAVDVLMNTDVLTGAAPIPPEGSILPETYEVQRGEDRAAVLQRMMDARDELLGTLWAQRAAGPALHDARAGGDPGLDRREGDRAGPPSGPGWRRCSSTG